MRIEINHEAEPSNHKMLLEGRFWCEIWDGEEQVDAFAFPNGIITLSINDMLDDYFNNGTTPTAFYLGLISNTGFTALSSSDSSSSHSGWTEETGYSESTRPAWGPGSAAAGLKTNSTPITFTATSDLAVKGLFVISNSTKGGSTGILWSTGTISTVKNVSTGQILKTFYELRARQG